MTSSFCNTRSTANATRENAAPDLHLDRASSKLRIKTEGLRWKACSVRSDTASAGKRALAIHDATHGESDALKASPSAWLPRRWTAQEPRPGNVERIQSGLHAAASSPASQPVGRCLLRDVGYFGSQRAQVVEHDLRLLLNTWPEILIPAATTAHKLQVDAQRGAGGLELGAEPILHEAGGGRQVGGYVLLLCWHCALLAFKCARFGFRVVGGI